MPPFVAITALSVLTVFGQLTILALILLLVLRGQAVVALRQWIAAQGIWPMLIVAATATIGSLYFSEIAGWTPCKLCWLQRIFMYPQVLLLGITVWTKDRTVACHILLLSLVGAAFAAVHYGEQVQLALNPLDPDLSRPCDDTGVSCARTPIFEFGYITIPLMALTAFVLNALGSLFALRFGPPRA